eukprot:5610101-Alexandrium_andersonii.AAC.1
MGGLRPPDPPEKRLRRTHRLASSSPLGSACKVMPDPPGQALAEWKVEAIPGPAQFKFLRLSPIFGAAERVVWP